MKLSEKIAKLRKLRGLSQEQLASRLDVTRQTVYKWEAGINAPELEKIKIIAKMFDVSCDTLLDDEKDLEGNVRSPKKAPPQAPPKSKVNKGLLIALIAVVAAIHLVVTVVLVIFVTGRLLSSPDTCTHDSPSSTSHVIKEATYTKSGIKRFLCPKCNEYYEEEYYLAYNVSVGIIERNNGAQIVARVHSKDYTEMLTVSLSLDGVPVASKEIHISNGEYLTVVFSADKNAGQSGEIVVPLENEISDRATATVTVSTHMDSNKEDNTAVSEYIYPQNAKILYVSSYVTDTKSCQSVLAQGLREIGVSLTAENMYKSPDEIKSYTGYDLVIFENVAPSTLPENIAVWLLNPTSMPNSTGVTINPEINSVENYSHSTDNFKRSAAAPYFAIDFGYMSLDYGIVCPSIKSWRAISSFSGFNKAYTANGDTVMVLGEINGQKTIVSSFDFNDTTLHIFSEKFPSLVRNMIVYSIVNGTYSIE